MKYPTRTSVSWALALATLLSGTPLSGQSSTCVASNTVMCAISARFSMSVEWSTGSGAPSPGYSVVITPSSSGFWFFSPDNVDLVVKVLDGRQINGNFWVFYGSLTDVQFTLTVTDLQTGTVRTYTNPQGHLASWADTSAF